MSINLKWNKLDPSPDPKHGTPCERSSNGLSLVQKGTRLILHGGENIARTPLSTNQATWAADKSDNGKWTWRLIECTHVPPPERVAHAQAVYNDSFVYIFGGRSGITMDEKAMNDLWCLDCSGGKGNEKWIEVIPDVKNGDQPPEERSFHKMICVGSYLYVFGGCSAHHGRLADIHRFDINAKTWKNLGSSPLLRGRGGANFLPFASGQLLGVVCGFCGEETNDGHLFDAISNQWQSEDITSTLVGLRPRSVCISGSFPSLNTSIIFGGEVDPSEKGHEGAGGFENDLVLLDERSGKYIATVSAQHGDDSSVWPEKRGWSDGATCDGGDGKGEMFIFGGLTGDDANPKRLGDLWRLDLSSPISS